MRISLHVLPTAAMGNATHCSCRCTDDSEGLPEARARVVELPAGDDPGYDAPTPNWEAVRPTHAAAAPPPPVVPWMPRPPIINGETAAAGSLAVPPALSAGASSASPCAYANGPCGSFAVPPGVASVANGSGPTAGYGNTCGAHGRGRGAVANAAQYKREVQPRQGQQHMQAHTLRQQQTHNAQLEKQRERKAAAAKRAQEAVHAVEAAMRAAAVAVEEAAAEEAAEVTAGESVLVSCAQTRRQLEDMEEAQARRPPMPCAAPSLDRRLNTRGTDMLSGTVSLPLPPPPPSLHMPSTLPSMPLPPMGQVGLR